MNGPAPAPCAKCGGKRYCLNSVRQGTDPRHPYNARSTCEFGRTNYIPLGEALQVLVAYGTRVLHERPLSTAQRAELENSIAAARRSIRIKT